ncbi:MAG TPA: hypothetical protein HA252_03730 [Candidatus Diapherotrites archaeon]|uniref:Glycosyl transferase family 28 C-terminal domain-containing protein n=1 Tax=Candidatus Iainarchaeum sp. TaxID=3101447 RepID=A0A7J4JFJ2_9ARCH|nr:hypothetical protein [Candidatus Diapherotrites archaeon]HIH16488.1 hypothetical protein [Candidatus Diapherotrites archaeon]
MKIFATLGTHPQPMDRLLEKLDELAGKGRLGKESDLFAQTGSCTHHPINFESKALLEARELEQRIKWADLVISHGGAGSIIHALRLKKKLIVVPRLERFGEHTDSHQVELAKAMERENKAIVVYGMDRLEQAIKDAAKFKPNLDSTRKDLVKAVKACLGPKGLGYGLGCGLG